MTTLPILDRIKTQPLCYVLIGPPACGKSTYREKLVERLVHPVVISSDDIVERHADQNGITYDEAFHMLDQKVINAELRDRIANATKNRHDIVIDRTNMTPKSRNRFLSNVPKTYVRFAVVFDYERDALIERMHERAIKTGKSIPVSVMHNFIDSYVPPVMGEFDDIIYVNSLIKH